LTVGLAGAKTLEPPPETETVPLILDGVKIADVPVSELIPKS